MSYKLKKFDKEGKVVLEVKKDKDTKEYKLSIETTGELSNLDKAALFQEAKKGLTRGGLDA